MLSEAGSPTQRHYRLLNAHALILQYTHVQQKTGVSTGRAPWPSLLPRVGGRCFVQPRKKRCSGRNYSQPRIPASDATNHQRLVPIQPRPQVVLIPCYILVSRDQVEGAPLLSGTAALFGAALSRRRRRFRQSRQAACEAPLWSAVWPRGSEGWLTRSALPHYWGFKASCTADLPGTLCGGALWASSCCLHERLQTP